VSSYTGRVAPAQARRNDEMQAVADALSLLANLVMAWRRCRRCWTAGPTVLAEQERRKS